MQIGILFSQSEIPGDTLANIKGNAKKISIEAYLDAYYNYQFNQPESGENPLFVSANRHNVPRVNLAYLSLKYADKNVRATLTPGFGTYMQANYAAEPAFWRYIVEANAGLRIWKKKDIWLDAGILGSPYTPEGPVSRDAIMYTRSFAPEYVPYYLTGAKLTIPISPKWTGYLYLLNGWQHIKNPNDKLAVGTQLEYRPDATNTLTFNTFWGDERSEAQPNFRMRRFADLYWQYAPKSPWTVYVSGYVGLQDTLTNEGAKNASTWWQSNVSARYRFTPKLAASGRIEYYHDPGNIQITPQTGRGTFQTFSAGYSLQYAPFTKGLIRLEARHFFSRKSVFLKEEIFPSQTDNWLVANFTIWL